MTAVSTRMQRLIRAGLDRIAADECPAALLAARSGLRFG